MRNKIQNIKNMIRSKAVTGVSGTGTAVVRKKGSEAIEKAVMLVVVLALCAAFKDALIPVINAIAEFTKTTAINMFS